MIRYLRNKSVKETKNAVALFRSRLAPAVLAALTQADEEGMSLRELARSVGATDSGVQRALRPLVADGYVRPLRRGGARRYVRAADHPVAAETLRLAMHELSRDRLAAVLVRANPDVEFAALHGDLLHAVFREDAVARRRLRLERVLETVPRFPLRLQSSLHSDVLERLIAQPELRDEARRDRILKGRLHRTFPDRRRHGDFRKARRLGRPHPSLPRLSRRVLQGLARVHGIARLALFGSAVRSDFRPDSDVDVLVRHRPGVARSLIDMATLQRELEALLDRDVDVIEEEQVYPAMRPVVSRERVVLYGRP